MGLCKTKETVDPEISPITHTNNPDKVGSEFVELGVSATTIYTGHIDKVTTDRLLQSAVCGSAQAPGQLWASDLKQVL